MGCDIHLHIELKIKGQWRHYNHPRVPRVYDLFAKMAGVRNYDGIEPIAEPKGLPDDVAFITKFCSDRLGIDGQSHSWLGLDEIKTLYECICERLDVKISIDKEYFGYLFGNSFPGFLEYPQDYPSELEDVRFVFWFDN